MSVCSVILGWNEPYFKITSGLETPEQRQHTTNSTRRIFQTTILTIFFKGGLYTRILHKREFSRKRSPRLYNQLVYKEIQEVNNKELFRFITTSGKPCQIHLCRQHPCQPKPWHPPRDDVRLGIGQEMEKKWSELLSTSASKTLFLTCFLVGSNGSSQSDSSRAPPSGGHGPGSSVEDVT